SRRFFRKDPNQRSATGGTSSRTAGIRPAFCSRSRDQQTSGAVSVPEPSESEQQSIAYCSGGTAAGVNRVCDANRSPFNGGVFKSGAIRNRVLELLTSWNEGKPVRELRGIELDLAVAKGASFYGRTRVTQRGIRIKAGAARSYYIGLESSMPAVPGFKPPIQ